MDGNRSMNVPQLPNISFLMDCTGITSNDAPPPSPSRSPVPQQFFLESKIHDVIVASEADIAKSLCDFQAAISMEVAAMRAATTAAMDVYAREAGSCHAQLLEAHAEFREAVVVSLVGLEERGGASAADFHDAVAAAALGLCMRLATVMAALERQQVAVNAACGHAAAQFWKAADAVRARLHTSNTEAADAFTRGIYALLHSSQTGGSFSGEIDSGPVTLGGVFEQMAGAASSTESDATQGSTFDELEKYRVVMQMMNLACSLRSKLQHLTSNK